MRARAVPAAVLALALVLLGACDDSDGGDAGSSTSTRRRVTTTTTATAPSTSSTTGGVGSTSTTAPPTPTTAPVPGGCGAQAGIITDAIGASDQLAGQAGTYTVARCRLAASSPIWAAAEIVPNPGAAIGPATVLLERIGSIWTVTTVGTGSVGCAAPAAVRAELSLTC